MLWFYSKRLRAPLVILHVYLKYYKIIYVIVCLKVLLWNKILCSLSKQINIEMYE